MKAFQEPFKDQDKRTERLLPIGLKVQEILGQKFHENLCQIMAAAQTDPEAFDDLLAWNDAEENEKASLFAEYQAKYLKINVSNNRPP